MKHVKTIRKRYTLQLIKFPIDCRRIEAFYALIRYPANKNAGSSHCIFTRTSSIGGGFVLTAR